MNWKKLNEIREEIPLFDLSDTEQGWFRTTIAINRYHARLINQILKVGLFPSRSELLRYCLNRYGNEILKLKEGISELKPEVLKVLL